MSRVLARITSAPGPELTRGPSALVERVAAGRRGGQRVALSGTVVSTHR